eukprot:TRINITY_DN20107_c0_g1_i1.p1 TRINITY_DN20107_c0_g1~~TRINITY_DN20107_c0_g1_i1.p1  ORF type:complete len:472 (-),score=62.78 TRINITY_DN20107_c0_g1_i1:70-1485(-)
MFMQYVGKNLIKKPHQTIPILLDTFFQFFSTDRLSEDALKQELSKQQQLKNEQKQTDSQQLQNQESNLNQKSSKIDQLNFIYQPDEPKTGEDMDVAQQIQNEESQVGGQRQQMDYITRKSLEEFYGIFEAKSEGEYEEDTALQDQRLLRVALMGVPNSGKSELFNALVGRKLTAVSRKRNTTQSTTMGAFMEGKAQIVLYDTPGITPHFEIRTHKRMKRMPTGWTTASTSDMILFVVNAHREVERPDLNVRQAILEAANGTAGGIPDDWQRPPMILVINKMDLINRKDFRRVRHFASELCEILNFDETFYVSSLTAEGLPDLRDFLVYHSRQQEWMLDPGIPTNLSPVDVALEVVREKLYWVLHSYLPYAYEPKHVEYKKFADGSLLFGQEIIVRKDREKAILVGKDGQRLYYVSTTARQELESIFGCRVHLFLRSKVRPKQTIGLASWLLMLGQTSLLMDYFVNFQGISA